MVLFCYSFFTIVHNLQKLKWMFKVWLQSNLSLSWATMSSWPFLSVSPLYNDLPLKLGYWDLHDTHLKGQTFKSQLDIKYIVCVFISEVSFDPTQGEQTRAAKVNRIEDQFLQICHLVFQAYFLIKEVIK